MKSAIGRIGKNASAAAVGLYVNGPLRYLVSLILARSLGAENFGVYILVFTFINLLGRVGSLGLHMGALKYTAHYQALGEVEKTKGLFWTLSAMVFFIGGIIGAFLFIFSDSISSLYGNEQVAPYLRMMAFLVPVLSLQLLWLFTLRGFNAIPTQSLIQKVGQPIINFVLVGSILWLGFQLRGALYALAVSTLITMVWAGVEVNSRLPNIKRTIWIKQLEIRKWITFSMPLFLELILKFLIFETGIEVLLLGMYGSDTDVGYYGAVYRLLPFIMVPSLALRSAFSPTIAENFAKKDVDKVGKDFTFVNRWTIIACLPLFLFIIFFGREVLGLFGEGFSEGYVALVILSIGFLVDAAIGDTRMVLLMTDHSKAYLINVFILLMLTSGLGLYLIPTMGLAGAAITGAFARVFIRVFGLIQIKVLLDIFPYDSDFIKPWFASICATVFYLLLNHLFLESIESAILYSIIGGAVIISIYLMVLLRLGLPREEKFILEAVRKKTARMFMR
jgi:O-antigen/teichoic acid export membrane protein